MADRAAELAQLLLKEGALRSVDPDHRAVRQELLGDAALFDEVRRRLAAVGYRLVERLGHVGVAPEPDAAGLGPPRNRMGLHAGHVRLIVYLWTHLVYREWSDLRRGRATVAPRAEQAGLFADASDEETPSSGYTHVRNELGEILSAARFKALLQVLQRCRFVRYDEKRDRIWAEGALYTLIDLPRMEDFVVDLARRLGSDDLAAAVRAVAAGSALAGAPDGEEDEP
ncbi:MAG: hypothetical protein U1F43_32395 [Myxococcota bacterium]